MWQTLISRYRHWRIARHPIPENLWSAALRAVPHARRLPGMQRARLRELATWFLIDKRFTSAHGLTITDAMCLRVAVKACLPILALGADYYDGFKGIVLYPDDFRVQEEHVDETGVVHQHIGDLCGQSIAQGPMVLSWGAIVAEDANDGQDLVIHECAHKLDTLNGGADGFPPLSNDMSTRAWTETFHKAYDAFCDKIDTNAPTQIDPYAAEDPAEFFAVASETFFTRPDILHAEFDGVYRQLAAFYKQDPYALIEANDK